MRTISGLHALLVSVICLGMIQAAAGQSAAKAEVLAALAERDKAFVAGDETKVADFMSEDYLQTDVNGNVQDKHPWLNEYYRPMVPFLKSGKTRWVTFDRSDIVVRDLGDTVIVAGKQTIKHVGADPWNPTDITPPDSPRPPRSLRFTHVWIKRGGAWKLAVVHNAIPAERQVAQTETLDAARLAPQMYKVIVENSKLRVIDYHLKPREQEPMHSHPCGVFAYFFTDADDLVTLSDGTTQ